jgi:Protein of unknown function (DUF3307)
MPVAQRASAAVPLERSDVSWSAVLLALLVSHMVGDVLFQTDQQALLKVRGLGDAAGRLALATHVGTYTLAFLPVLVWIGLEMDLARALLLGLLIAITHLLIDDGRLVGAWVRKVKRATEPGRGLLIAVDQSFHVLCLLGVALLAVA